MQRSKRFLLITLLILWGVASLALAWPTAAQGQNGVHAIPISLLAFNVALSPDAKTLAAAADHNMYADPDPAPILPRTIYLIDLANGKETAVLGSQTDFTDALAFSPDGTRLVSFYGNGQLNVWDVSNKTILKSYHLPGLGFATFQFFPDGKRVAVLAQLRPTWILVVDIETGAITATYGPPVSTRASAVNAEVPLMGDLSYSTFALAPDGRQFATVTLNDEIDLWDTASGGMSVLFQPTQKTMHLDISPIQFSPDGKSLVYYHHTDDRLHVWDLGTQKERAIKVTGGDHLAFNAKGDQIAWIAKQKVYTWDFKAASPTKVAALDPELHVQPRRTVTCFTPDNAHLIVANLASSASSNQENQIYVIMLPTGAAAS